MDNETTLQTEIADHLISGLQHSNLENPEIFQSDSYRIETITLPKRLGLSAPSVWMIDEEHSLALLHLIQNTDFKQLQADWDKERQSLIDPEESYDESTPPPKRRKPYQIQDKVAYINIGEGSAMTKRPSCMSMLFGSSGSYISYRRAIREALMDNQVNSIALIIDTPGGEANGAFDLADDIYRIQQKKPIYGYAEDICASGGLLIGSQCTSLSGNSNVDIGSLGAYTTVVDRKSPENATIYVIKSGKYKAIGVPGNPVTKEQLAYMQRRIDSLQSLFVRAVVRGRSLTQEQVAQVADASVYLGKQGIKVGLLDTVESIDDFHERIVSGKMKRRTDTKVSVSVTSNTSLEEQVKTMAAELSDVKRWMAGEELVDENTTTQTQVPVSTTPKQDDNPLLSVLAASGITSVTQLNTQIAMAKFGASQDKVVREQAKRFAIVALGPDDGQAAESIIDSLPIESVQALAKQYIALGEQKGLLSKSGTPIMERITAPADNNTHDPNAPRGASTEEVSPEQLVEASMKELQSDPQLTGLYCM